ncbi:hypothetical protein CHLRE_06g301725v5 [Chlamydomonas reinhardtii]|uniref:Uncharacterized protein n=1 Tax=Chlamydomonas reinhardtii TaxID=3055 RepID=A0A2K3DQZ7_CHLRE|nr:uncharacterized protein CHLRE_06g301725v5 [Chlamydomonas reinhardtii]PNW82971.1 hypothetical protein CHLRE_06g301725v5 [Chlamydomonas reinhardtii]
MGAVAALMRVQFVSGTHAIASALYSVLRPGDEWRGTASGASRHYSPPFILGLAARPRGRGPVWVATSASWARSVA